MASQNQNGFHSQPLQYNNDYAYTSNGYPEPSNYRNLLAHQNAEAMGSLPELFHNQLMLSPNRNIGALGQRPTLDNIYTESQTGTGLHSEGMFAVFTGNMHHENDVAMSGQQPKQELKPEIGVLESVKEEDEPSLDYGDSDDQDDDADPFSTTSTGRLQRLEFSWIPWDSYTEVNQLFDEDGNRVKVVLRATTAKEYGEDTVNGHRYHVMYRRNYFRVEGHYRLEPTGKKTGRLFVNLGGEMAPIEGICATVRGVVEGDLSEEIEICTFDSARKKLDEKPSILALTPSNEEPLFADSTAVDDGDDLGTWRRMQWRRATANNGARRAKKSTYNIVVPLMVQVRSRESRRRQQGAGVSPETELVEIGYSMSGPIQARGRCPITFEAYDPTNVYHKRRRENRVPVASKYASKTGVSKNKKQDAKMTRQLKKRTIVPRPLTPSTGRTSCSRSPSRSATQTSLYSSPPRPQAPTAPMANYGAARTEVESLSDGDFQRHVLDEFGIAGENRYEYPAPTPMWPPRSEAPLLSGISAWAYPSESGHPDGILEGDLNFDLL